MTLKATGHSDKSHSGFITLQFGAQSYDVNVHTELPPVREGGSQENCDGKGLDSLEVCLAAAGGGPSH